MKHPHKFWWQGEPLIVGSLRWQIVENDLLNEVRAIVAAYKKTLKSDGRGLTSAPTGKQYAKITTGE